jgi:hypothetical protein
MRPSKGCTREGTHLAAVLIYFQVLSCLAEAVGGSRSVIISFHEFTEARARKCVWGTQVWGPWGVVRHFGMPKNQYPLISIAITDSTDSTESGNLGVPINPHFRLLSSPEKATVSPPPLGGPKCPSAPGRWERSA